MLEVERGSGEKSLLRLENEITLTERVFPGPLIRDSDGLALFPLFWAFLRALAPARTKDETSYRTRIPNELLIYFRIQWARDPVPFFGFFPRSLGPTMGIGEDDSQMRVGALFSPATESFLNSVSTPSHCSLAHKP